MHSVFIYIAVMAAVSYAIRVLPFTIIRRPITNVFVQSFLYYVPYVTLSVMTFPAILHVTSDPLAGAAAMLCGIAAAWFGLGLLPVASICCAAVFICEALLS